MKGLRTRTDPATTEEVRAAVAGMTDPELGETLDELGMVGDITVRSSGAARITVRIASAAMADQGRLRTDVEHAAMAVDGVSSAEVVLEPMDESGRMQVARLLRSKPGLGSLGTRTRVYAVASGKGGVGKSVVTANLAASLAAAGQRVGVIDADVWGYSVPQLFGVRASPVAIKGLMLPVRAHGVRLMSVGFFVNDSEPVVWRGPMLHKALEQFVADVYWGQLDVLLLDLPPGTGDVPMSLIELLPDVQLLLVTTPQAAVATVAGRVAAMARDSRVPVVGVIENMATVSCQACGTATPVFGEGAGKALADDLDVPLLGQIPIDPELLAAADDGTPVVLSNPGSPAATELAQIAGTLPSAEQTIAHRPLPLFVADAST